MLGDYLLQIFNQLWMFSTHDVKISDIFLGEDICFDHSLSAKYLHYRYRHKVTHQHNSIHNERSFHHAA